MAVTAAGVGAGIGVASLILSIGSGANAAEARASDLRSQATSLRANAISLRFEADQEIVKARLSGLMANNELGKAQATNLTRAFARGTTLGGSNAVVAESLAKEADFFRAVNKVSSDLTAGNLRRVAFSEESEAERLDKAARKAESKILGIF